MSRCEKLDLITPKRNWTIAYTLIVDTACWNHCKYKPIKISTDSLQLPLLESMKPARLLSEKLYTEI